MDRTFRFLQHDSAMVDDLGTIARTLQPHGLDSVSKKWFILLSIYILIICLENRGEKSPEFSRSKLLIYQTGG